MGKELHIQMGFFDQSVFADQYTHSRGLWVVSLEHLSTVALQTKKIFLVSFFPRSYGGLKICERVVWTFLVKFDRIYNESYWFYVWREKSVGKLFERI